jgi:hypothetical protein
MDKLAKVIKEDLKSGRGKISDEGLKELERLNDELRKIDEKNRIPPTKLFCINCGKLINDHYEGQCYSYTHFCNHAKYGYKPDDRENDNLCTSLTTEDGPLISTSWVLGDFDCRQCKECNSVDEHAERIIQSYLGKHYKEYAPENPKVAKIKADIIEFIKEKTIKDSSK